MQIILDISANTHLNLEPYYKRMVGELAKIDYRKHEVVLKWQLFERAGDNRVADINLFCRMAIWAWEEYRYRTTASVFDTKSLTSLTTIDDTLPYELPFIKIANNPHIYWLIGEIPRKYRVYRSGDNYGCEENIVYLQCVSKYPSSIDDYSDNAPFISDHTIGLELWHRNKPLIWEKHYKLPDSTGLDAGPFAITPDELKEVL
jgi:hypothetical protein